MGSLEKGVYWFFTMKFVLFGMAAWLAATSIASADVHVTMQQGGRVSIVAKDATVRQILTEWARVGQTKIVNVERIPGGPVTLELSNVPEAQALDVLLRALSGYITAMRPVEAANLSQFDRIIIMPTLASARPAASSAPAPVFQQTPQFNQQPVAGDDEPDDQRPTPVAPVPPNRGPVFNTFPQPQVVNPPTGAPVGFPGQAPVNGGFPQQGAAPPTPVNSAVPTAPFGGVAVPGMVAPTPPPQPGQLQPGQVPQPGQPVRRPGGNQ
jgi:hypothetical protein